MRGVLKAASRAGSSLEFFRGFHHNLMPHSQCADLRRYLGKLFGVSVGKTHQLLVNAVDA